MAALKLFLCHASADKPFVRHLGSTLMSLKQDIWLDENEIKVGDSILGAIEEGLKSSDYVIIIMSPDFMRSEWAKIELESTLHQEIVSKTKKVLICLLKDTEMHGLIKHRKYADFRTDFAKGFTELIGAILPDDKTNSLDVYVKNSIVTIDIVTIDGSLVKYKKSATHVSLINDLKKFDDCLSVPGEIKNLRAKGVRIRKKPKERGQNYFEIIYPKTLNKNDEADVVVSAQFIDSFLLKKEYWETQANNHNTDKFTVIVVFPKGRPPKRWYMEEKDGTKPISKTKKGITSFVEKGRVNLVLEVAHPVNYHYYILRWSW